LSTFRFTSVRRDLLDTAAELFGGTVREWNSQWEVITEVDRLDVLVPPEDVSFSQWWETWSAGGCTRRCDGVRESITDTACPCLAEGNRVCEPITRLSVILPAFATFGVWRVETSSWYAAGELQSSVGLALQLAERTGSLAAATRAIDRRVVKRPGDPPRRFVVPVLDVQLAPVGSSTRTLGGREKAVERETPGMAALSVASLPTATPRIPRGEPTPPPAASFGEHDDDTPPSLLVFAPVVTDERPTTPEDPDAKFRRGCFAQVRDVLKERPDLDADVLRYGLAVIETAKRRDEPVTSWSELTHEELTGVSTRLTELRRGQLQVEPLEDQRGVVFTTSTGRTARVFADEDNHWTFQVIEPTKGPS
jgi:hypothetical protein